MNKITLLLITVLCALGSTAQIRLVAVDPNANQVSIKNFGSSTVDISAYRLCSEFTYTPDLTSITLVSGSLNLAAGATVVVQGFAIDATGADLGLYLPTGAFSDANAMVDFTQWLSAGNGRESVAVTKGIWSTGDFITGNGPYFYIGDGNQNGLNFWSTTPLSTDELGLTVQVSVFPNPMLSESVFTFSKNLVNATLTLWNVQGKKVKQISVSGNKASIKREELGAGTYFYTVIENNKHITKGKLIIE